MPDFGAAAGAGEDEQAVVALDEGAKIIGTVVERAVPAHGVHSALRFSNDRAWHGLDDTPAGPRRCSVQWQLAPRVAGAVARG